MQVIYNNFCDYFQESVLETVKYDTKIYLFFFFKLYNWIHREKRLNDRGTGIRSFEMGMF